MSVPTTELDAAGLVQRLRATYDAGTTRPFEWREQQLDRLAAMLSENEDELIAALATDLGRPAWEAWVGDVRLPIREIEEMRKNLRNWAGEQRLKTPLVFRPGKTSTRWDPLGVVLVIAPWNYPIQLLVVPMAAAIAAGNTVVAKPSEVSPATSAALTRLTAEYLDPEAVTMVEGGVPETTALLDQKWDHIFFTGNGTVGRIVATAAAKNLTPVTLELGGQSPTIVDKDANLELAAGRIAFSRWSNAGQTCVATNHVFVHEDVEEEFLAKLTRQLERRYGKDPKKSEHFGRIINEGHAQRIADLLSAGGYDEIVVGGTVDVPGRYIAPTVLRGVKPDAQVMQEEIFGPILPVITFSDISEAIDQINAGGKPLAMYVFSKSDKTVDRVLSETSAGGVSVNDTMSHVMNSSLPFGGVGESGSGAYHGRWGFETFSHRKAVYRRPHRMIDPPLFRPPYTKLKFALTRKVY